MPHQSPDNTVNTLRLQCHALVDRVARRPGAAKLLLGVKIQLQMFAAYKLRRQSDRQ